MGGNSSHTVAIWSEVRGGIAATASTAASYMASHSFSEMVG